MKRKTCGYSVLVLSLMVCEAISVTPARAVQPLQNKGFTPAIQHASANQFERIYLSSTGALLGAHVIIAGTTLFVDPTGHISFVTRDYTAKLDYNYRGKINRIGNAEIVYDYTGRIQQIGSTLIDYGYSGSISQIGSADIAYTRRGNVTQIGDVEIRYDRNLIETISSNYTSAGASVVVLN